MRARAQMGRNSGDKKKRKRNGPGGGEQEKLEAKFANRLQELVDKGGFARPEENRRDGGGRGREGDTIYVHAARRPRNWRGSGS